MEFVQSKRFGWLANITERRAMTTKAENKQKLNGYDPKKLQTNERHIEMYKKKEALSDNRKAFIYSFFRKRSYPSLVVRPQLVWPLPPPQPLLLPSLLPCLIIKLVH